MNPPTSRPASRSRGGGHPGRCRRRHSPPLGAGQKVRLSLPCQVPAPSVLARSLCIPLALGKRGVQSLIMQPFGVVGSGAISVHTLFAGFRRQSQIVGPNSRRPGKEAPFCGVCRVMRQLEKQRWPSWTSHWPRASWCKPIVVNLKRGSRELAAGRWDAQIRAGDGTESERGDGAKKSERSSPRQREPSLPAPGSSWWDGCLHDRRL